MARKEYKTQTTCDGVYWYAQVYETIYSADGKEFTGWRTINPEPCFTELEAIIALRKWEKQREEDDMELELEIEEALAKESESKQ